MESLKLLSQAALQMVRFGPLLNARVGYNSVAALPQGLVAAGAACSATTVDNDDAQGQMLLPGCAALPGCPTDTALALTG